MVMSVLLSSWVGLLDAAKRFGRAQPRRAQAADGAGDQTAEHGEADRDQQELQVDRGVERDVGRAAR